MVDPGTDLTVTLSGQAFLDAKVSGPDNVRFASPGSEDTAVSFPVTGTYELRLTVADGELADSDEITVTVAGEAL